MFPLHSDIIICLKKAYKSHYLKIICGSEDNFIGSAGRQPFSRYIDASTQTDTTGSGHCCTLRTHPPSKGIGVYICRHHWDWTRKEDISCILLIAFTTSSLLIAMYRIQSGELLGYIFRTGKKNHANE